MAPRDPGLSPAGQDVITVPRTNDKNEFDFIWQATEEPHLSRRKAILKKHPEIMQLVGPELLTFPIVLALTFLQIALAAWAVDAGWFWVCMVAYIVGGTVNHSLQLANHEISHNLCFQSTLPNVLLGIFANFVTGVPSSAAFRIYHMDHHQNQGVEGIDTDVPTPWEVGYFQNSAPKKLLWVILQPFFYALRPLYVKPHPPNKWEVINFVSCVAFDAAIVHFLGWKAFAYLLIGTFSGLGLHPAAGHFIAEHYVFVKEQETYSYYGPLNYVNFNVGFHNEHHDFPRIPWSRLPMVRKIAPEFYDNLAHHTSYCRVIYEYITDPAMGPFSRVKRATKFTTKGDYGLYAKKDD